MQKIIEEIRIKLPTEVQHSVWIVAERSKIIEEAERDAQLIRQEAEEQMQAMIEKNEITQFAKERANLIVEAAEVTAYEMRQGAVAYAIDKCNELEKRLRDTLEQMHNYTQNFEAEITELLREVYDNKYELKGMANQLDDETK